MLLRTFRAMLSHESTSGVILLLAAALALALDNSPLAWIYDSLLTTPVILQVGAFKLDKPLLLWINDGLMTVFFLLVSLEIKREILQGQLSSRDQLMLPGIAALGGMAVPAVIYVAVTWGQPDLIAGWAIPAATDIAFALGVLALLGERVPLSLKVFLLALAIIDDLGAIVIIALFYTNDLSTTMLVGSGLALAALALLNRLNVGSITPYVLIGALMWWFVLKSGVHSTLAGVVLAFAIPLRVAKEGERHSPLGHLEHKLRPWVAYGVMPIFAFANAGVSLAGLSLDTFLQPLPLGITLGLFLGKQFGIFGAVWLTVKAGWARLPEGVNWGQIYGVSCVAGIGFTMSLFIGTLAFADLTSSAGVRIGVLSGSLLSALIGYGILRLATNPAASRAPPLIPAAQTNLEGTREE